MQKNGNDFFVNLLFFSNFYASLLPLWLSILLKYFFKICFNKKYYIYFEKQNFKRIFINYHFWFIFLIVLVFFICLYIIIKYAIDYKPDDEEKIFSKVKRHRTLTINFILTYVLPIMAFDFWNLEGIFLFLIYFIVLSFLIIKNRIFDGNIVLELLNYYFYDCIDKNNDNEYVVIFKEKGNNKRLEKETKYKLKFINQNDVAFAYKKNI